MEFGHRPSLCATLWEDLQRIQHDKTENKYLNPKHFLMALHALKRFPTDNEREGSWNINPDKGRAYELGIAIAYPRLVWMNGPFRAGKSDVSIFRDDKGLKEKLHSIDKKAIGTEDTTDILINAVFTMPTIAEVSGNSNHER
jgi:hypothetical protein